MTLFVASLFLPYTINFNLPNASPRGGRPVPPRRTTAQQIDTAGKPSLFTTEEITPPETPTEQLTDNFFFSKTDKIRAHFPKLQNKHSTTAPNDPHSPIWGSGRVLTQPRSRATTPPPQDILEHNKILDKATALGRAGIRQPQLGARSASSDRVFVHADWSVESAEQGNGGLRNAVEAAVRSENLTDKIWVGTLGMPTDALDDTQRKQDIEDRLATEHDSLTVFCKDSDFDGHYGHYCKQILWPVFHYQIPDNPKSKAYEDHSWVYYVKVNQAFADKIVKNYKRGDVIWVHDYHLLLVPAMIRKKLPDAKIGFFLHVAFPSSEVFRCLAVRKELLEGMLGANLVGFQIQEYARHFLQTCSRLLCVEATTTGLQLEDRFVDVCDVTIGIDPVAIEENRAEPDVQTWIETLRERYQGMKLIVARDKLDHVRGVRQKLLAYELFLNKYPQWRDKVVMIQVATSSTDQGELDATVSDIVTRVNSSWANLAYQPLVYLKQDISYAQYLALITVADALMIASQREGMNLTSHEFLYCQDGKLDNRNKHGSLILSEFTGSACLFGGQEISVNPWDFRQCAEGIKTALEMEEEEKDRRYAKLHSVIMHHTAEKWLIAYLEKLDKVYEEQNRCGNVSVPRLSIGTVGGQYQKSQKRLFLLDYEGTLASYGSPTSIILTSPQRTLDVLNDLVLDEHNIIYIMSSRQPEELDQLFIRVPNLGLIAENGCFIKNSGSTKWLELADGEKMREWKDSVEGIMRYHQERTPGSWIETRHCSLIFHYKDAEDFDSASRQAGDCASYINEACAGQRVRAIPVEGAVIVEPIDWSKGTAAKSIFENLKNTMPMIVPTKSPVDFLMVAGDGPDDEVCFRWANDLAKEEIIANVTTVSLGSRNTEARCTLTQGVTGVLTILQKLSGLSTSFSLDK